MKKYLERLIKDNHYLTEKGKVADYIPALKAAKFDDLGISILDKEGNLYSAGDYKRKFTIQSISKVIGLMQAVMDNGRERVFESVGYEGTEDSFNSLYRLDFHHVRKPSNPMINSGAILTSSLIKGSYEEKFQKILNLTRIMAKNPDIGYSKEVYLSEKETGDKNRALAYLMKSRGMLSEDVEESLDVYFKQCSIELNTVDLANIGLNLSNACKDINIGASVNKRELCSLLLSIMSNCGMYNYSGKYMVEVGIPSKSGVGGGILGVVPKNMGIGIYGPSLDSYGNSIAGIEIIRELSKELNLSIW